MRGVKNLVSRIEGIKNAISNNIPDAIRKETQTATGIATGLYNSVPYAGTNDVVVSTSEPGKGEFSITASGSATLFLEFGTGILTPRTGEQLELANQYPPGSWSAEHSQYLTDPEKLKKYQGYWPLPWGGGRLKTKGNPPANAMYQARKHMETNVPVVARVEIKRAFK